MKFIPRTLGVVQKERIKLGDKVLGQRSQPGGGEVFEAGAEQGDVWIEIGERLCYLDAVQVVQEDGIPWRVGPCCGQLLDHVAQAVLVHVKQVHPILWESWQVWVGGLYVRVMPMAVGRSPNRRGMIFRGLSR